MQAVDLENLLLEGVAQLNLSVNELQQNLLKKYSALLLKWNKVYNLTAIIEPLAVLKLHLLDGLSVIKYFTSAQNILDVGSGMGVPGIILAIMLPQSKIVLVDSNNKKTAFLRQVKIELNLANLDVHTSRIEEFVSVEKFSMITSRAFADLSLFIKLSEHLLKLDGQFLAMKSSYGIIESERLNGWSSEAISLKVPFLDAQRFLIKMLRK